MRDELGGGAGKRPVQHGDFARRRQASRAQRDPLVERRDKEQPAAGARQGARDRPRAEPVGVGLDDGGARGRARRARPADRQFAAMAPRSISRTAPAAAKPWRPAATAADALSQSPSGRRSGPMKLSNFVVSASKCSLTVPIGPWRCLAMMTSAVPKAASQRSFQRS